MKNILLVSLLFIGVASTAQNLNKKVSLSKGQQYEQVSLVNMNITQEMMGQAIEMKMESSTNNLMEVKEAANNSYLLSNTLKRIVMNMSGVQEIKFDSDKKEDMDNPMAESVKDRIGKSFEVIINQDGIITEVKNKDTKDDPAGMSSGMMNMFEQDAMLKEGATYELLANLPAKGVKVGDSWSDSTNDKNTKTFNTYTLKEIKGNEGFVTMSGNTNISRDIEQEGMSIQISMQGTTLGEYTFDVATRIIKAKKSTTKASGTVEAMGQSIPMTADTIVNTTITKK